MYNYLFPTSTYTNRHLIKSIILDSNLSPLVLSLCHKLISFEVVLMHFFCCNVCINISMQIDNNIPIIMELLYKLSFRACENIKKLCFFINWAIIQ